jgi:hypothetical protein
VPTADGEATHQDLIRWLALPYQGGEPIFAHTALSGGLVPLVAREIDFGGSLRALYREVTGWAGGSPKGHWQQCPSCLLWHVENSAPDLGERKVAAIIPIALV